VLHSEHKSLSKKMGLIWPSHMVSRSFTSIERFSEAVERSRPQCALISAQVPGLIWEQLIGDLADKHVEVVIFEARSCALRDQLLSLGAIDALPATSDPKRLARALTRAVALSKWHRHSAQIYDAKRVIASLTRREREVLAATTRGLTARDTAIELDLSPRTIEMYRASIVRRLRVERIFDAVRIAYDAGLVQERRSTRRY